MAVTTSAMIEHTDVATGLSYAALVEAFERAGPVGRVSGPSSRAAESPVE